MKWTCPKCPGTDKAAGRSHCKACERKRKHRSYEYTGKPRGRPQGNVIAGVSRNTEYLSMSLIKRED